MSATKKPAKKTPAKKKPATKKPAKKKAPVAKKESVPAEKISNDEATIIYANDVKNPKTRKRFLGWLFN